MRLSLLPSLCLVYAASLCYVVAAYYHLTLGDGWTFFLALSVAMPIVAVEYCFALPGNYALNKYHGFEPSSILIITIAFYFINLWLLNVFVLKKRVKHAYVELAALLLVLTALYITSAI